MSSKEQNEHDRYHKKKEARRKVLPDRKRDTSKLIPVYIPSLKAAVYVEPGTDIEAVKKRYLKQRERTRIKSS